MVFRSMLTALLMWCMTSCTTASSLSSLKTHTLSYDAIVSPALVKSFEDKQNTVTTNETGDGISVDAESSLTIVPQSLAEYVNTLVAGDILQLYVDHTDPGTKYSSLDESRRAVSLRCYAREGAGGGRTCTSDHAEKGMETHIASHFDIIARDNDEPIIAVRFDVTMAAAEGISKEILIRSVPKITAAVEYKSSRGPIWSVRSRPSILEMGHAKSEVATAPVRSDHNTLEDIVLSDNLLQEKMRIHSVGLQRAPEEDEDVSNPLNAPPAAEIWQYYEAGHTHYTRALFIESTLRSLTSTVGSVHAESFAHPLVLAHPDPARVAVFSESPFALVKELLKHYRIDAIDVVGVHPDVLSMVLKYMPSLNDCSGLKDVSDQCFEEDRVNIVSVDAELWIDEMVTLLRKEEEGDMTYDVILLDIPSSDGANHDHWLSSSFQKKLKMVMNSESALIINAGSEPSMDVSSGISEFPARDSFLQLATRKSSAGGLGYEHVTIYDEPLAYPLDTSFIVLFPTMRSYAYNYFYRKIAADIDLDLMHYLVHTPPELPTIFYDGPTHTKYVKPFRTWETWYCNNALWKDLPICTTFRQTFFDESYHHYNTEVRGSATKDRSVHAVEDIPKGHYFLADDTSASLRMDSFQWDILNEFLETFPDMEMYSHLRNTILAYGYESEPMGSTGWSCSLGGNSTFINHACSKEDQKVGYPKEYFRGVDGDSDILFSPPITRRSEMLGILAMSYVDIKEGDEIMMDYRTFHSEPDESLDRLLGAMCTDEEDSKPVDKEEDQDEDPKEEYAEECQEDDNQCQR